MGRVYGAAWINLLYDIDTKVRITDLSKEIQRINKIEPSKYLIIPHLSKVFPEDLELMAAKIAWEPKTIIEPPKTGEYFPVKKRTELKDAEVGSIYKVTLIKNVINIEADLKKRGIPMTDSANEMIFNPGELEQLLSSSKKTFLDFLRSKELEADERRIYFDLVSCDKRF